MQLPSTLRRRPATLNLTPLIDIIFLLIVFFMLTSSFILTRAIDLNLSAISEKPSSPSEEKSLLLFIEKSGQVRLGDKTYPLNRLARAIIPELRTNPARQVVLVSGPDTSVQHIVTAMDEVKKAGGKNISLAEKGEGS